MMLIYSPWKTFQTLPEDVTQTLEASLSLMTYSIIAHVDELGALASLPKYATDLPDILPSSKIEEGDLFLLNKKIDRLATHDEKLRITIQENCRITAKPNALLAKAGGYIEAAE